LEDSEANEVGHGGDWGPGLGSGGGEPRAAAGSCVTAVRVLILQVKPVQSETAGVGP